MKRELRLRVLKEFLTAYFKTKIPASAGRVGRTVATKLSGTILNGRRLVAKGRAPRTGRVTAAVYVGVHEHGEPPRNADQASVVIFKTCP